MSANHIIARILASENTHEQLTEYLQALADRHRLYLSATPRYTDLYIDGYLSSSLWDMPDEVPDLVVHQGPVGEGKIRALYWARFGDAVYPICTIFFLEDID